MARRPGVGGARTGLRQSIACILKSRSIAKGSQYFARSLLRKDFFYRYKKGHSFEQPFLIFGCGSRI
ncbi:hypothetical protein GDH07_04855 [Pseudomonas sp. MC042]|uniref:Uncharacterized protein n=1 Tax=Pseudomonas piscis TaxID=2614538 RepID=A0A7X1PIA2_9PSED|nr:hypothetical protein [Pseudomonas piscis]